jgi:hypothetical protein
MTVRGANHVGFNQMGGLVLSILYTLTLGTSYDGCITNSPLESTLLYVKLYWRVKGGRPSLYTLANVS